MQIDGTESQPRRLMQIDADVATMQDDGAESQQRRLMQSTMQINDAD